MIFDFMILHSAGVEYSEVITFMKNKGTVLTMYKEITTSLNKTISLSPDHLLYARRNATGIFNPM